MTYLMQRPPRAQSLLRFLEGCWRLRVALGLLLYAAWAQRATAVDFERTVLSGSLASLARPALKIAIVGPVVRPEDAAAAEQELHGIELFFQEFAASGEDLVVDSEPHRLELVYTTIRREEDANATVDRLVDSGVKFFLTYFGGQEIETAAVLRVQDKGGLVISSGTFSSSLQARDRRRLFSMMPTTSSMLDGVLLELLTSRKPKSVAYLVDTRTPEAHGKFMCKNVDDIAAANGVDRANIHRLNVQASGATSDLDLRIGQLQELKADVVIGCLRRRLLPVLLGGLSSKAVDPKIVLVHGNLNQMSLAKKGSASETVMELGQFVVGLVPWSGRRSSEGSERDSVNTTDALFVEAYRRQYDVNPTYKAAASYAASETLLAGLRRAAATDPGQVATVLEQLDDHVTVIGQIAFDRGRSKLQAQGVQLQASGTPFIVLPKSLAERPLIYPKPPRSLFACLGGDGAGQGLTGVGVEASCEPCQPGQVTQLVPANSGTAAAPPEAMDYVTRLDHRICVNCSAGYRQTTITRANMPDALVCVICPRGSYQAQEGTTQCLSCPAGRYNNHTGMDSCVNCPRGKYSPNMGGYECFKCPSGFVAPLEGSRSCLACPAGAMCGANPQGVITEYVSAPEYYVVESQKLANLPLGTVYPCPHVGACLGNNTCKEGSSGVLCGECAAGYARSMDVTQPCEKCPSLGTGAWWAAVNIVCFIAVSLLFLFTTEGTDLQRPDETRLGVYRMVFNYGLIMSAILSVIDLELPLQGSFKVKLKWLRYIHIPIAAETPAVADLAHQCTVMLFVDHADSYKGMVLIAFFSVPVVLLADLAVLSPLLAWRRKHREAKGQALTPSQNVSSTTTVLSLMVIQAYMLQGRVTMFLMVPWMCSKYDKLRSLFHTSIDCESNEAFLWQIISLVTLLLVPFGVPALFGILMRACKVSRSPKLALVFGSLTSGYRSRRHWFELLQMIRRTLPWIVIAFARNAGRRTKEVTSFAREPDATLMLLALMTCFVLFSTLWPYDSRKDGILLRSEMAMYNAAIISLGVPWWLSATNTTALFEDQTRLPTRLRDITAFSLIIGFHLRFFFLVLWTVLGTANPFAEPASHGANSVTFSQNGLRVHALSQKSRKILGRILGHLAEALLREGDGALNYDDYHTLIMTSFANALFWRELKDNSGDMLAHHRYELLKEALVWSAVDVSRHAAGLPKTTWHISKIEGIEEPTEEDVKALHGKEVDVDDLQVAAMSLVVDMKADPGKYSRRRAEESEPKPTSQDGDATCPSDAKDEIPLSLDEMARGAAAAQQTTAAGQAAEAAAEGSQSVASAAFTGSKRLSRVSGQLHHRTQRKACQAHLKLAVSLLNARRLRQEREILLKLLGGQDSAHHAPASGHHEAAG
eukprot:TRINITY_DN34948_c0_g1_i1.p1 TRINITY_DN34948_c0_g1~~TRINITY_DN34948_c0_g1_i1.p1  ORF type:complete len:1383 (+),score=252.35 TRINITY_DN34948_c0_g1_i1:115-4263(+)